MPFYVIRRKIFAHLRIVCLMLSLLGVSVSFNPRLHAWLDSRMAIIDNNTPAFRETLQRQSFDELMLEWDKVQRFGNISRHHRMAEVKTAIWWALVNRTLNELQAVKPFETATKSQNATQVLIEPTQQLPKGVKRSIKQWLDKNKRNLDMQLAYAQWQYASGKTKKAISRVRKFARDFPQHQALVAQYKAWSNEADAQLAALPSVDPEIVRYLDIAK